jgi:hypothetical protein
MSNRINIIHDDMYGSLMRFGEELLARVGDSHEAHWPDETTQRNYTGSSGQNLMQRTVDFVWVLQSQVPVLDRAGWRGLDYGVGWGRIASLLRHFGNGAALDCVDAWRESIRLARDSCLDNRMTLVSPMLAPSELPDRGYDFIYAYSIFTHLPADNVVNNLTVLYDALKPGGKIVFTVREIKFLDYLKTNGAQVNASIDDLDSEGYWFGNAQNSQYGDTITTTGWISKHLGKLGPIAMLGFIDSEPFQTIMVISKSES